MTTWEYKTVHKLDILENERLLSDLGYQGWELCAIYEDQFYFKRCRER